MAKERILISFSGFSNITFKKGDKILGFTKKNGVGEYAEFIFNNNENEFIIFILKNHYIRCKDEFINTKNIKKISLV